jgi:predicted Zn-dependent peptidase
MECIKKEVEAISAKGVTDEELDRAREQIKGGFILGMENTSTRMMYLGKNTLLKGYVEDQDEIVSRIDALTKRDVEGISAEVLNWDKAAVSVLSSEKRPGKREGCNADS